MKKLLLFFSVLFLIYSVNAQDENEEKDTITIDDYYIDFAVPDLSALGMLGIENDEIVRPGNLKKFAAGIANFVDTDGSLKQALALEWNFMNTYNKKDPINFDNAWQPRNLSLSLATSEEDSLGLRLGFGLKWVPLDKGDPMGDKEFYNKISTLAKSYYAHQSFKDSFEFDEMIMDILDYTNSQEMSTQQKLLLQNILNVFSSSSKSLANYRKIVSNGVVTNLDSLFDAKIDSALQNGITKDHFDQTLIDKDFTQEERKVIIAKYVVLVLATNSEAFQSFDNYIGKVISEAKEDYRKRNWNAEALMVATGVVGHSTTSTYNDLTSEKFSIFASYSMPTVGGDTKKKVKGQLIAQIKYEADLSGDSIDYNHFSIGAKHLYGNSNNRLSTELLYSKADTKLLETDVTTPLNYLRYTLGAELKISDGTWLELAFGGQKFFEGEAEENAILTNFGFKHALRNKRRYEIK